MIVSASPIHGQSVYLDADLRARLLKEKGVKPFRIWQRPGQVVFIPAGLVFSSFSFRVTRTSFTDVIFFLDALIRSAIMQIVLRSHRISSQLRMLIDVGKVRIL